MINSIKMIRGSKGKEWPDGANYTTKLEAMQDPRSDFDCLRESFFIPDHANGRRVVDAIYEIASSRDDGEACLAVADRILCNWLDCRIKTNHTWCTK